MLLLLALAAAARALAPTSSLGYSLASVEVNEIRLQNWLSIANVLVMVLFLIWVRRKMRDKSWKADAACTTASDYTVMLQHLRTDESPEFFERQVAAAQFCAILLTIL